MLTTPRVLVLSLVLACGSRPHGSPATPAEPGLQISHELVPRHGMLLIGDLHGTAEIPRFVAAVVASVAAEQPVVLALEVIAEDSRSIDEFLASDGGPAARARLIADPWWTVAYQDGRRSLAMAELLDAVRRLRANGRRVDVVRIDEQPPQIGTAGEAARDQAMATHVIAARKAHPDAAVIVFAGNYHTRKTEAANRPGYHWMGMQLLEAGESFISINPRFTDGSAWMCGDTDAAHCGPKFVAGAGGELGIHLEPSKDGSYDGWFGLGTITASPPNGRPAPAGFEQQLIALRDGPDADRARALHASTAKDFTGCTDAYAKIAAPTPDDAYNHACCLARLGRGDAAFERLQFSIDHGLSDLSQLESDEDLASLHADPRWPPKPH